ncbi:hypothetical protein [Bordetella bronchiseptica]|uniref:hypothetical protein n=1 Tax=Bordetella bronchiseptica TaxID=518 RepID=UPI00045A980D|nr:hypothetical protein [Bordetella bronchiseptica]KAK50234.1 hypothetical protein L576_5290 [Bordetella bronchiseptica OSU054]
MPYDPMNQTHPGPLEGIDRIHADTTQARTGNTEREQETWFSGVEEGQRRTEHNAAVRRSADGWKLVPIEPTPEMIKAWHDTYSKAVIKTGRSNRAYAAMLAAAPEAPPVTVALDPDPRGVSVGVWQGSRCIYTGAHPLPAAPGSPASAAPGDAPVPIKLVHLAVAEEGGVRFMTGRKLPDGIESCELYAMPDYGRAPAALFRAPAAGDARDALRELVECDNLKKRIASMQVCALETDDDVQELDAMMSDLARRQPAAWDAARAALAAQQHKGDE